MRCDNSRHQDELNGRVDVEDVDELRLVLTLLVDVLGIVDDVAVNRVVDVDEVHELVDAGVVEDVVLLKEALGDLGVVELVVPDVEVEHDALMFEDVLVDTDVIEQEMLDEEVHELVHAGVVGDVDVLEEAFGNVGVDLDVEVEHDTLMFEDVLVDADIFEQDLCDVDVLVIHTHVIAKMNTAITCIGK